MKPLKQSEEEGERVTDESLLGIYPGEVMIHIQSQHTQVLGLKIIYGI